MILCSAFDKNVNVGEINNVYDMHGRVLDNYLISAESSEDNYSYVLDAEFIDVDVTREFLKENNIIKVQESYGTEIFPITKVNINKGKIKVTARQYIYDKLHYLFLRGDVRAVNMQCAEAMQYLYKSTQEYKNHIPYAFNFGLGCNITDVNTSYFENCTLIDAFIKKDQALVKRWNGQARFRGNSFRIDKRDSSFYNYFELRNNKNLRLLEINNNIDDTYNCIYAEGENIKCTTAIFSPNYKEGDFIRSIVKKYDVTVQDVDHQYGFSHDYEAIEELKRLAMLEFTENKIDKVKNLYNVEFIDLKDSLEYKEFDIKPYELHQELRIVDDDKGISVYGRIIGKKYDILKQRTINIELEEF